MVRFRLICGCVAASPSRIIWPMDPQLHAQPLYLRLSSHYRQAIQSGVLMPGERMPSVRALTRLHQVSLSTAVEACHTLEDEGLLEARPRSGYFVLKRRRVDLP